MGFLQNLLKENTSQTNLIPKLKGENTHRYDFVFTREQWLRGQVIKHKVEGVIQSAISPYNQNYVKWEINFEDINLRKTTNFIPEYYILWDFVRRANFYLSKDGRLTTHQFKPFGQKEIYREKEEKIYQYLSEGSRRDSILKVIKGINNNSVLLARALKANPIIQLLTQEFCFFQESQEKNKEQLPVFCFQGKEVKEDYFGNERHLPLKKISVLDTSLEKVIIGSSVNGWDKEPMNTQDFFRFMKQLAGKVQIGRELLIDSSDFYEYADIDSFNQRKLTRAESSTQTLVADAWFLDEQTTLTLKEEDYGSR